MLRTDRIELVAAELCRLVADTPLPAEALPAPLGRVVTMARLAGVDLTAILRAQVAGSIASLASRASADPARADELAAWVAHLLAWLRDERDDPPPADLPLL